MIVRISRTPLPGVVQDTTHGQGARPCTILCIHAAAVAYATMGLIIGKHDAIHKMEIYRPGVFSCLLPSPRGDGVVRLRACLDDLFWPHLQWLYSPGKIGLFLKSLQCVYFQFTIQFTACWTYIRRSPFFVSTSKE